MPRSSPIADDGRARQLVEMTIDSLAEVGFVGTTLYVIEVVGSLSEVRTQDVINSESLNLYRQLAGGGTVMQGAPVGEYWPLASHCRDAWCC